MNIKSTLFLIGIGVTLHVNATDEKFFKAIHQTESSGRTGRIIGDSGKALGPLQIHRDYFKDAAQYDKSLGSDYNRVTDLEFSKKVVTAYLKRFVPKSVEAKDYQTLAKTHNGGPNGRNNPNTNQYWQKVKKHL